jgi:SAM-dependent methyltransferase
MPPTVGECPACGGPLRAWRRATASNPGLAGRAAYELARCEACGTARTIIPAATQVGAEVYEAGTYAPPRRGLDALLEPLRALIERDKRRFARGLPPGARVLEVGAGDGRLVAGLRAAGHDASGIEPSARAAAAALERGAPVERTGIEAARIESASLDAAFAWHVLEHLPDPAAAVGRLATWVRPGGMAVIACPNLSSLQARLGGDRWFHQDVPRHHTHFTERGLRLLLERNGFRVERVSHVLVEQNPLGMWQTLLNRATRERDVAFRLLKGDLRFADGATAVRDLALTGVLGVPLLALAPLLELAAGLARRGGSVVVEARLERAATGA